MTPRPPRGGAGRGRGRRVGGLGLFLIALSLGAGVPAEARERVALFGLHLEEVPAAERPGVRDALERALAQAGLEVVPASQVARAEEASGDLERCLLADPCRAELGHRLLADYLLTGSLGREDDAWVARLALFDVALGQVARREQLACLRCALPGFERRLGAAAGELVRAARALPRGTLVVRTRPPGVEVRVDRRLVGTSDLELTVAPGLHVVELGRAAGMSLSVDVKPRDRRELDVSLPEVGATVDAPLPSRAIPHVAASGAAPRRGRSGARALRVAGGVLLGVGAALVIAAVPLFVLDGRCGEDCAYRHQTLAGAVGLVVPGALALAGGAALTVVGRRAAAPVQVRLVPTGLFGTF